MRGLCAALLILGCASAPPPPASAPDRASAAGPIPEASALIERIRALLARSSDQGPLRLRLASALQDRAVLHARAESRALDAGFAHPSDSAAREAVRARAARHAAARVADLERALAVLSTIEPGSPQHAAAVEARFWLLAERREWEAESLAAARAILEAEEQTPLAAAAHLRLAEFAFERAHLVSALARYERVLAIATADGQTRRYASYKRAWTLVNMERYAEAERAFAALASGEGPGGEQLAREAARDRVRVHVWLQSPPAVVLAAIAESTADLSLRASLATRYEAMLRDAGREADADAFRAALLQ